MNNRTIDLEYLNEMSGGEKELILEMIDIFNKEVPVYLNLMSEYIENKDWNSLSKMAHKAKASASIMGISRLAKELRNLEIIARDEKYVDNYLSFYYSIEIQFNTAIEELTTISKTL